MWRHAEDVHRTIFSASATQEQIPTKRDQVTWARTGWLPQGVPRYSLLHGLLFKIGSRLGTESEFGEGLNVVFFVENVMKRVTIWSLRAPYTFTIWLALCGGLLGDASTPDWDETLASLTVTRYPLTDYVLIRMCFQTTLYFVWRERNARSHQGALNFWWDQRWP